MSARCAETQRRKWRRLTRTAHFRQSLRRLCDHVYLPLQLLLQVGDVHLVRDAIGVADALHIAVRDEFIETPHYGYRGSISACAI